MAVKDLSVKGQRKFWLNRYIPAACYVISALSILMFFLKANNSWIKILLFIVNTEKEILPEMKRMHI